MPKSNTKLAVAFLFDDTLDSNDGVAQQVKRLGEWFSQNGHHVIYLCGETKMKTWAGGNVYSMASNVNVRFNGNRLSMPLISSSQVIKKVLEHEPIDILHVQVPYSPLMAQRVIKRAHGKVSIVGTFHILPSGWLSNFGSKLLRLVQWRSLKKFDEMISVSSSAASFARKNFGLKSEIIPNMIDLEAFRPAKLQSPEAGRIVFLGRLVKRKGCEQLIRAFALVSKGNPDSRLVIAGDGPERRKLKSLASSLGLDDGVSFLGFVKEEDKASLLASASIACFPSLYGESFGVVLIEAMAAGAGVVLAGNNPGYQTVMEAQPSLLIDPRDAEAFAGRLNQLLQDSALRAKLHAWQNQHVKHYDTKLVAKQVLAVYERAIAKRSKSSHNEQYAE
jgi:phosphatidylinositol alpha-mannosyltransferase